MSGRGVLFAVDDEELAKLGEAASDAEVRAIVDAVEQRWEPDHSCELEKSWDAIHRALTDGKLAYDNGRGATRLAVLGGKRLYDGDDAIVVARDVDATAAVARALAGWDEAALRRAYFKIDSREYGDLDEEDFQYTWAFFQRMRAFYAEAARAERSVVFVADL